MNILVVNTGSSSVQLQRVSTRTGQTHASDGRVLLSGKIENLGQQAAMLVDDQRESAQARNHEEAVHELLDRLGERLDLSSLDGVVHRVVHGGTEHRTPTRIDDAVIAAIERFGALAPLHNAAAAKAIRVLRKRLPALPQVAVFDTAFHATLPEVSYTYAIDPALAQRHLIRRFGFHGTALRYMLADYAQATGIDPSTAKVIGVHLGGGASVTAIDNGRSVDTSMGMTPLEGLVMGTRSGDIDPAIVGVLARGENITVDEALAILNQRSGLRALSGFSQDTRELVKARDTDPRARLALDLFCYRIIQYIGAYLAVLGGADAILLGGVICENTPWIRHEICRRLSWCGLDFDRSANDETIERRGRISTADSRLAAWVIPAREDLQLAHEAATLLTSST